MRAHHVDRVGDRLGEQHRRLGLRCAALQLLERRDVLGVEVVLVAAVGVAAAAEAEPDARAGKVGGEERVERDREPGVGRRLPHGVVHRVVERPPVDRRVRAHEHRHHAGELGDAADLGGDARDVVGVVHRRDGARTEQPALAFEGVVRAPVVVRARLGLGEVDVAHALQPEQHRRVQHREVDAVLVHVLQARLGVPRRRADLGVAELTAERAGAVLVAHARGARGGHVVRGEAGPVVDQPLLALRVGLDVPDAVAVLGRRVVRHRGRVLEDVAVRVDVAETGRGGGGHAVPPGSSA